MLGIVCTHCHQRIDPLYFGDRPGLPGRADVTRPDADAFVPLSPDEMKQAVLRFSHDVMSPLMSVHALSQVLLLEARPDARLNEDLRRIQEAAEEALALVRSLGVRITAGRNNEDEPTGS